MDLNDSPVKGAPPTGSKGRYGQLNDQIIEMLDLALGDVGEWYSIPLPAEKNQGGYASTVAQMIGRRFADISTKEGRLWIKIKS
jgi:hypothetical protein